MKITSININDTIRVKLTPKGETIIADYYNNLNLLLGFKAPLILTVDQDGYYRTLLWEFMNRFGKYMILGSDPLFTDIQLIQ